MSAAPAGTSGESAAPPATPPRRRRWAWVAAGAALLVAGGLTATVAVRSPGSGPAGEVSAQLAAQRFVAALNAGNRDQAAAVSCPNFRDEARSVAESGADPDIDFLLDSVAVTSTDVASAQITQRLHFPSDVQRVPHVVHLDRTDGRWLVCGTA